MGETGDRLSADDRTLLNALRTGDEAAFMALVDRYQAPMLRLARMYVATQAVAEEVVQDAWVGVLKGIEAFEGRSSLRTWMFRILVNIAKTRGQRESRTIPFASAWTAADEPDELAAPAERFLGAGERLAGEWVSAPQSWDQIPEDRLLSQETLAKVMEAIASLPPAQAEVIRLRDVEGWSSQEVCNALSVTETNQRVLLHRARSKVRAALERYLEQEGPR